MNVHFLEKWLLGWKCKGQRLISAITSLPRCNGDAIPFILLRYLNQYMWDCQGGAKLTL